MERDRGKFTASAVKLEKLSCLPSSKILRKFQGKEQRAGGETVNQKAYCNGKGKVFILGLVPILCFLCPFLLSSIIWQFTLWDCSLCFIAVYSYLQVVLLFDLSLPCFLKIYCYLIHFFSLQLQFQVLESRNYLFVFLKVLDYVFFFLVNNNIDFNTFGKWVRYSF